MSYLRIATHPAIFARPLSSGAAMDNIDALLRAPHARLLAEEDGFMDRDFMKFAFLDVRDPFRQVG